MHKIAPFNFAETQLLISAKVMQSGTSRNVREYRHLRYGGLLH
jgi:hypothetical protein